MRALDRSNSIVHERDRCWLGESMDEGRTATWRVAGARHVQKVSILFTCWECGVGKTGAVAGYIHGSPVIEMGAEGICKVGAE